MNKQAFYNSIRASLFSGRLTSKQVEGINFKLDAFDRLKITDDRWKAYMLTSGEQTSI